MRAKKRLIKLTLLLFFLWAMGYVLFSLHAAARATLYPEQKTDALIVLTGGNNRIRTGLELYAKGLAPQLFITGVHKAVEEKEILAQWGSTDLPLPPCCMVLGHEATTTTENASETKDWVERNNVRKIRLITSSYHMSRALLEFHTAMPDIEIIPQPVNEDEASLNSYKFWVLTFSEYNKTLFRSVAILLQKDS